MTKPKTLRNYFKKMYGVDLDAMSSVGVLKQFFKEKYDFDAEGSTVSEVLTSVLDSDIEPSGGGGGDFSIANVTFINNTDTIRTLSIALASPAHDGVPDTSHWNTTASRNGGTTELKVILYHGEAIGMIDIPLMGEAYVPPENVTVTGDITMQGNDTVIINGDGTITLS